MSIEIREADLRQAEDAQAFLLMLDAYARDAMGGGAPLDAEVTRRLVPALAEHPGAHVLLAWEGARPLGVATCFVGFSTFAARPLLNVHDLGVVAAARGRGVGRALLAHAEALARSLGCVKLSLEVLEDNSLARGLYASFGFRDYELGGVERRTLFLTKPLPS
ncbi:MAG: family N-acetyltransferase [Polyangiaceae bacterium]|jgi:GNAT superfamily N-acetyltransferase|nr:family N-acetyltransferase [Polyangiaceae bacterium]